MKRSIQRKIKLSSTFLLVLSLAMTCSAVQESPLPDGHVAADPPAVTAEGLPAADEPTTDKEAASNAKLIVLQPKSSPTQTTTNRVKPTSTSAINRAVLSLVPTTHQSAQPSQPTKRTKSTGILKLVPAKSASKPTSSQATKPTSWTELDIPKHVLHHAAPADHATPAQTSPVVRQPQTVGQLQIIKPQVASGQLAAPKKDQSIQLQPIRLKSGADSPTKKPTGVGQLQIIKSPQPSLPAIQSGQVQRSPLQPIQLKSETGSLPTKPATTSQLQVIKSQNTPPPVREPERVNNITLQPIVLQSKTEPAPREMPPVPSAVAPRQTVQSEIGPAKVLPVAPVEMAKPEVAQTVVPTVEARTPDVMPTETALTEMAKPAITQTKVTPVAEVTPDVLPTETAPVETVQTEVAQAEVTPMVTTPAKTTAPAATQSDVVQAVQTGEIENEVVQAEAEQNLSAPPIVVQPAGVQLNVSDPLVTAPAESSPIATGPVTTQPIPTEPVQTETLPMDNASTGDPQPASDVAAQEPETEPTPGITAEAKPEAVTSTEVPATQDVQPEAAPAETPAVQVARNETAVEPAVEAGAVSAAGIPFYPAQADEPEPPQNPEFPRGKELEKVLSQNVGQGATRPGSSNGRDAWQGSAELISSSNDAWILNRGLQDPQTPNKESVVEGKPSATLEQITPGTGDYFLGSNETGNGPIEGCGNPECIGCYGGDEAAIARQMECCGSMLCARRYFIFDALYMNRDDGGVAGSNFFSVSTPYNFGYRATLGWRQDAAEGTEITYWGSQKLSAEQERFDPSFRLDAAFLFDPSFGIISPNSTLTGFYQADFQAQQLSTEFQSFEYNRTKWAWDVFKSFYGMRMIYFDDRYLLVSQNQGLLGSPRGELNLDAQNILFGPQIGAEYFYDVGYKVSFSLLTKIGIHANFTEMDTQLDSFNPSFPPPNQQLASLNNVANKTKVAGTLEVGFQTHYQLAPQSRLRLGYNALWMWGVITAEDNFPGIITPFTGTDPQTNNSGVLMQGINFGLEFYR